MPKQPTPADSTSASPEDPSVDTPRQDAADALLGEPRGPESGSRDERIRDLAYQRYQARGDTPGDADQDWLDAEAEVDSSPSGR